MVMVESYCYPVIASCRDCLRILKSMFAQPNNPIVSLYLNLFCEEEAEIVIS